MGMFSEIHNRRAAALISSGCDLGELLEKLIRLEKSFTRSYKLGLLLVFMISMCGSIALTFFMGILLVLVPLIHLVDMHEIRIRIEAYRNDLKKNKRNMWGK